MSSSTNRTSFILDAATRQSLGRLAGRLSISQAEVVRRSIRLFEQSEAASETARAERVREALARVARHAGKRNEVENLALVERLRQDRIAADLAR